MFPQLPSTIDNLTSAGIIDFDAESYVKGTAPRYIGAPRACLPFEQPLPVFQAPNKGIPGLPNQPKKDEFVHKAEGTPAWKKTLAGLLVAGLIAAVALKFTKKGSKLDKFAANSKKLISEKTKSFKEWFKTTYKNIKNRKIK